jgi:D-beta-D-heptose 7-phosphate kinase/D-beta-D-heptose 1-phosphate adenosyltransferase
MKTVFTNGCFDILHRGHLEYLQESAYWGDRLIVGINSDASVRKLKGNSRPVNNQNDRKYALECLEFVDRVYIFDEPTPWNLIKYIRPDIITKGSDYIASDVVGSDLARIKIIPLVQGYSTTNLIERILNDTA